VCMDARSRRIAADDVISYVYIPLSVGGYWRFRYGDVVPDKAIVPRSLWTHSGSAP